MAEAAVQSAEIEQDAPREQVLVKRETGFWTVFVFTFSMIGLLYTGLLPFSKAAGLWPGSNLAIMLGTALFLSMINAYTFSVIGILAPHYGADYLVSSRVLSAPLGFASSFVLVFFLAYAAGIYVSSLVQDVLPMLFQILSLITHEKSWLDTISTITQPATLIMIGTILVIVIFGISMLPPRITHYTLFAGFVIILAVFLVMSVQIISAPGGNMFAANFDDAMGPNTYLGHLTSARSLGLSVNPLPGQAIFAGLLFGYWIFYGYSSTALLAGEVKNPKRNLLFGNWAALLLAGVILIVIASKLQNAASAEWLSAESYLSLSPNFDGQAVPWMPLYLALLRPNLVLIWAAGIARVFAMLALALAYVYVATRIILAWNEDNLVIANAAALHPALHSPTIAVLVVSIIAIAGVLHGALSHGFGGLNQVFFMACTQILPVLGLILLPFRNKDWFERAPGFVRAKLGPLPVISLVGAFSLLYLLWMMVSPLFFPSFGVLNLGTILFFAVIFVIGLAWFFGRRRYLKTRGQNLDEIFKQIPTE